MQETLRMEERFNSGFRPYLPRAISFDWSVFVPHEALLCLPAITIIIISGVMGDHRGDAAIGQKLKEGKSGEGLFFELAVEDLTQAADLFRPIHELTCGVDGWVSLEVSPLLAHDTKTTLAEVKDLHARAARPNLFIKIPGTKEGLPAIEEAIFAGIPINDMLHLRRLLRWALSGLLDASH
jgi:Transaldolase/Fructose-6-phosphate aldolase